MNLLNYHQNVSFIQQKNMESEDKVLESAVTKKNRKHAEQKLLKDLIKNVEAFLINKDLRPLSESLKRIFYHGLSLDSRVSDKKRTRIVSC